MNNMNLIVLNPESVAELLRCSVRTVEERTVRGDLPGLKFGRDWVFPEGALAQRLTELAIVEAEARAKTKP